MRSALAGVEETVNAVLSMADNAPKRINDMVLGGLWLEQGLNKNLVAMVRPIVENDLESGQGRQTFSPDILEPTVAFLFEDGDFAIEAQYSTPFEASNPEGRLPNLMGMIQSGQMASAAMSVSAAALPGGQAMIGAMQSTGDALGVPEALQGVNSTLEGLKGRSNFTKINSRQIYTSSSSVRITGTVSLNAWSNAKSEVEAVLSKLQQWASPKELSKQSLVVGLAENGLSEALFPSLIPPMVSLSFGGATYSPLVIESVSAPMTGPMNSEGNRLSVKAQITFVSLMAWDKKDVQTLRG